MMKKLTALLLTVLLLCMAAAATADAALRGWDAANGYVYVEFGRYPYEADGTIRPILWRVLTVDGEKAYLCSEFVLFAQPMHIDYRGYSKLGKDFGQTDMCRVLNGVFLDSAFSPAEQQLLLPCETYGKVFLLDSEDVKNKSIGMGIGEGLKAWGTPYALANGVYKFQDKYGGHCAYWVRNQSTTDKRHARCTKDGGQLGHINSDRENEGARPAVYLRLDAMQITGGQGTKSNPYVITVRSN